jgi:hypothetical protein
MSTRILQIVPRLPPHNDGVGDYALRLATQLRKDHKIDTHFLAFHQGSELEKTIEDFAATSLPAHDCKTFMSVLPPDIDHILLQYSNYPYLSSKLKAPFWLPDALQSAIEERQLGLTVMFHELPWLKWKKIRILNPIQCLVSRRLGRIANTVITNNWQSRKILEDWLGRPVQCLPVFSTIGESDHSLTLKERKRQLVIFGSTDRDRVYRHSLSQIRQLCHEYCIETLCDVGQPLGLRQRYDFNGIDLVEMGFQPAEAVRQILSESLFSCVDYSHFPGNLAKSSVFAATCAHGAVPLLTKYDPSEADGLILDHNYLLIASNMRGRDFSDLQLVADHSYQWYLAHNLSETTKRFLSFFM